MTVHVVTIEREFKGKKSQKNVYLTKKKKQQHTNGQPTERWWFSISSQ